ncbi:MAG: hypothetical protein L0228_12500 [Planctomycetes bacterium]|nr:hypothetical protein [Planctomycetota bacterium]
MYFWNLNDLKSLMANRPLTDREVLPYVIAYSVLTSAAFMLPTLSVNRWDAAGAIWSVALAIGGTIYVYRRNGGSAGEHFLQRLLVIGWVVAVRLVVVFFLALIALFVVIEIFGELSEETTWYEFLLIAIWELIGYERVAHHVGDVAQRTAHFQGEPA